MKVRALTRAKSSAKARAKSSAKARVKAPIPSPRLSVDPHLGLVVTILELATLLHVLNFCLAEFLEARL